MDMHEPLAYSGARMGHALLRKRQDVAVSEAHIAFATWVSSVTIEPKCYIDTSPQSTGSPDGLVKANPAKTLAEHGLTGLITLSAWRHDLASPFPLAGVGETAISVHQKVGRAS